MIFSTFSTFPAFAYDSTPNVSLHMTPKDLEAFLTKLPSDVFHTESPEHTSITRAEPAIVFIPGFLGSKLLLGGDDGGHDVVWGCIGDTIRVNSNLSYDMAPALKAEPLLGPDSPEGDCAFDVYREFFDVMDGTNLADQNVFLNFAYDWRQSNDESARDLDAFVRRHEDDLTKKKVVFIAHSMGGLVFKWWYHYFYLPSEKQFPFQISRIYFVGTPHSGSYATAHALKHGYTLLAQSGTFLGWLEQQIAPALNSHGLSFPSFYQMLPYETESRFNSKYLALYGQHDRETRIDLFTPKAWRRLGFPNLERLSLPINVSSLERFYSTKLPSLLKKARNIHKKLAGEPSIDKARYVFSFEHKTPYGLEARHQNGRLSVEISILERSGDGTVFVDSAKNASKGVVADHMIRMTNSHSDLIVDGNFIGTILDLRSELSRGWEYSAALQWKNDPGIIDLFANKSLLMPTISATDKWTSTGVQQTKCTIANWQSAKACSWINSLDRSKLAGSLMFSENIELNAIGEFNAKVLEKMANNVGFPVGDLSRMIYMQARANEDVGLRQELYQSYISIEKHLLANRHGNVTNFGWAFNNLGNTMLIQGAKGAAAFPLRNAHGIADWTKVDSNLLERATKNLEVISK